MLAGPPTPTVGLAAQLARKEEAQPVQATKDGSPEDPLLDRRAQEDDDGDYRRNRRLRALADPALQPLSERPLHPGFARVAELLHHVGAQGCDQQARDQRHGAHREPEPHPGQITYFWLREA